MEKRDELNFVIKEVVKKFLEKIKDKEIYVVSHFDTDGITSATIMTRALKRLDKNFSVKILKSLEDEFISQLPKNKIILFLDLASGSLEQIEKSGIKDIFIIDHHEVIRSIPENVTIINPELNGKEKISSSGLVYLFCKEIDEKNKEFAKLGILGMIGDMMERNIDKLNNEIINDSEVKRKRGLMIYPSTRPINRTLEYCSEPFIPGVTGNTEGVIELLKESGINVINGKYKSLMELEEEEVSKLITGIMLRNPKTKNKDIIGDIFLIKFFNKVEDARELSAVINACSRLGDSGLAIEFCMEIPKAKKKAEQMHVKYKQFIVSGLRLLSESETIAGNGFVIINAKEKIKDTMIGTLASILSNSSIYEEGTVITAMAYYENKIKVSMRNVGKNTRNLREILSDVVEKIGGNVGGHDVAAGCIILQEKEQEFIDLLKKSFEIELVKV
jgi:single-stranded-DNA-specific exonuclease